MSYRIEATFHGVTFYMYWEHVFLSNSASLRMQADFERCWPAVVETFRTRYRANALLAGSGRETCARWVNSGSPNRYNHGRGEIRRCLLFAAYHGYVQAGRQGLDGTGCWVFWPRFDISTALQHRVTTGQLG